MIAVTTLPDCGPTPAAALAPYASLPDYEDVVLSVGALRGDGKYGLLQQARLLGEYVRPGEPLTGTLASFDVPVRYVYQHTIYDAAGSASPTWLCRFDSAPPLR
ncbi:hypothetical protein [Streptomyces sp. NPDC050704]|uniref:hypothetical protein n=1 Tax=Streptomyces sp. NPDC050704 TaxID=3157219 RepID=UPI003413E403